MNSAVAVLTDGVLQVLSQRLDDLLFFDLPLVLSLQALALVEDRAPLALVGVVDTVVVDDVVDQVLLPLQLSQVPEVVLDEALVLFNRLSHCLASLLFSLVTY